MTTSVYLNLLDDTLQSALRGASDAFVETQARFVTGCQQPDGGFCGRQGSSDAYYSDFALRCLNLLAPNHAAWRRAEDYVLAKSGRPRTVVECFSILNMQRMLHRHLRSTGVEGRATGADGGATGTASARNGGASLALPVQREQRATDAESSITGNLSADVDWTRNANLLHSVLTKHLLPTGGLVRSPGERQVSAYQTFLGALCFSLLDIPMPNRQAAIQSIRSLQRADGGFAESDGQAESQTNATAAAVAFLTMYDAMGPDAAESVAPFFAAMQSADGGLRAHSAVLQGDLLSTFTGVVSLKALDRLGILDTAGAARFLQASALASGGFVACEGDLEADVEYTYYGLGVFALLR
jgi:geranylgeranyl transferase type-2 subunit beta